MANIVDSGAGRTGPYWRRKLGITLPGERTQEQLNMVNMLRAKAGLPALGGPAQRGAIPSVRQLVNKPAFGGGPITAQPSELDPVEQPGLAHGGFEGPLPNPQLSNVMGAVPEGGDMAAVRYRLLRRFQQPGQQLTSRDALRQFVMQSQQRTAMPGRGKHPILPQRQPLRKAVARHPY